jgi:hypothetical protein
MGRYSKADDKDVIIKVDKIIRKNALSYITQSKESAIYKNSILLLNNNIYNMYHTLKKFVRI